jgi:hypothetical protein
MGAATAANEVSDSTPGLLNRIGGKLQGIIDALFPPEKRAAWCEKLQKFAVSNPKIAVSFTQSLP